MPRKALVVDSDYFFVEFLSGILTKRGYEVRKAYDGKQGIAGLDHGPYDILFADLVMPKVNGRQFFEFVRRKYNGHCFPIVAVSGTVIEQMDDLDAIGADYFIAKGPMEKLEVRLNEFIADLERGPSLSPSEKTILQTGSVFPRRDAMELLASLEFYQTVINAMGVGVIVLDKDTRVINANPTALKVLDKTMVDILNRSIMEVFPSNRSGELVTALKESGQEANGGPRSFFVGMTGRMLRAVISPLRYHNAAAGWIVALEGALA